ncbi:hypothetical protein KXV60_007636, partial [Aspergillus fumigatus]
PTGHCPSSPGGGGARVPAAISAGQLARVHGGGDPEGTGRHRCPPASPEKGVWAPLQAPGAAGPQQGYLTAYTTRLDTSVVCRGFIPARGDIAIRQPATGTDSDLEAFSHYPADGSVAALPGQTAAKTNYLNQRFLSY